MAKITLTCPECGEFSVTHNMFPDEPVYCPFCGDMNLETQDADDKDDYDDDDWSLDDEE